MENTGKKCKEKGNNGGGAAGKRHSEGKLDVISTVLRVANMERKGE